MLSFLNVTTPKAPTRPFCSTCWKPILNSSPGYGQDRYCDAAKEKIRAACACPDADVFFHLRRHPDQPDRH